MDLHHGDSRVRGTRNAAEPNQAITLPATRPGVDEQHGLGSAIAGLNRLGDEIRVPRVPAPPVAAFGVPFLLVLVPEELRLVPQDEDDLVADIEVEVVVVSQLIGGSPVTRNNNLSLDLAAGREVDGDEILAQLQIGRTAVSAHSQTVALAHLGAGGQFELLEVGPAIAGRVQAVAAEAVRDVFGRKVQFLHAGATAAHLWSGQELHVLHVSLDSVFGGLRLRSDQRRRQN